MKYCACIRFVGTEFHGFQVQPDKRTVMSELMAGLEQTFGQPVKITGCSRTDAGVHALKFYITVEVENSTLPPEKLPIAAIPYMPKDLSVMKAWMCDEDFHPRYSAHGKTYRYTVINEKVPDPFLSDLAWYLPRKLPKDALFSIREAMKYLVGKHDFSAFMANGSDVTDTVRTVTDLHVETDGSKLDFYISADGFLYNMVRIIVGTLIEVGFGRFAPSDVAKMVEGKNRKLAGMTAPAQGLYLYDVSYENGLFK